MNCAGCGRALGQPGDRPMVKLATLDYIHNDLRCRKAAVRAWLEEQQGATAVRSSTNSGEVPIELE